MEDLKARYYNVSKQLLLARGVENHPILSFCYNPDYDRKRKHELEKYILRPHEYNIQEKKILDNIKEIN